VESNKPMIVDVQLMMEARIFAGPLESFRVCVEILHRPSGTYRMYCNVLEETRMCALVSRLWEDAFCPWCDKEMQKLFETMLVVALNGAFDLCDRESYPFKTGPPLVSTFEHVLLVQGIEVVAVCFRRTGKKNRHVLSTRVSQPERVGMVNVSEVWRVRTPRSGWKMLNLMLDEELDQWNAWLNVERKVLHVWIRALMGLESSVGPVLPTTV
jgi:hypothetical protein